MPNPKIEARDILYTTDDGYPILDKISFFAECASVAIIGKNGSGKSTLLRILANELSPTGGMLRIVGRVGYLPQKILRNDWMVVGDFLNIEKQSSDSENKEERDIRYRNLLQRVGLGHLSLNSPIMSLSGGELVRVALSATLLKEPDILLLDEPTNNLDAASRKQLIEFLSEWHGLKIIATHDRELLETLDIVSEFYNGKCSTYKMKYPEYVVYRRQLNDAAKAQVAESQKHLASDRKKLGIVLDRRGHQTASAEKRVKKDLGVHRLNLASVKSKGQATTSRLREIHLQRIAAAKEEVKSAEKLVRPENKIEIDIPQMPIPSGKRTLEFNEVNFAYNERPLWRSPISFYLAGSNRMAIIGPNGSGKTTILRLLCGKLQATQGKVNLSAEPVVYLDQFLDYLSPEKTILENVWQPDAEIAESVIRTRLARLFFRRDTVYKKIECLSGGEKLRVALAKLFCAKKPPQLLLLDEPTNNLDLDSCEQFESALSGFKGAMVVVSHDYKFLNAIGAETCLDLTPYCTVGDLQ